MHTFHIYESRSTYFCYSYIVARISLRSYYTLSIFAHFLQFSQRILSRFYCILSIFMNQFLYLLLYCCKNIILLHTFYTSTFDLIAHLWITINYFCTLYISKEYHWEYHYCTLSTFAYFYTNTFRTVAKNIIDIFIAHTFYTCESRLTYFRTYLYSISLRRIRTLLFDRFATISRSGIRNV